MKTLAVLYICTGAYVAFWRDFYPNFKANFLPDCDRTFFVFTDADHIAYEDAPDVRRIPQQALPWPYSTMQRFDAFLGQEAALAKFDYLFFALDFNYIIELQTKSVNKKTRCCLEPKR